MVKKNIGFKINFIKNIGEMSDTKIEMLTKEFSKEFPNKNDMQLGGLILTKNIDGTTIKSLFVTPTQVTYSIDGENVIENFTEAGDFVQRVFNLFFLNYKCVGVCNFSCTIEDNDFLKSLKDKINIKIKGNDEAQDVGIKIFVKTENFAGNFIYEPYIKNAKYIFCSLDFQIKKAMDVNHVIRAAKEILSDEYDQLIDQALKIKNLG